MSTIRIAYGTVTSISPFEVELEKSATSVTIPRLASYTTPAVDDFVAVLVTGTDQLVIGKIG